MLYVKTLKYYALISNFFADRESNMKNFKSINICMHYYDYYVYFYDFFPGNVLVRESFRRA